MIPKSHPRYESLLLRDKMVKASKLGYLADSAMIAHGRGEAFDYLIGEKTTYPAKRAMYVAVAALLLSNNPVISVNGNATALACEEIIELANSVDAKIEITYSTGQTRELKLSHRFTRISAMIRYWAHWMTISNTLTILKIIVQVQVKLESTVPIPYWCHWKMVTGLKY